MIEIRYSENQLDISGTIDELNTVNRAVLEFRNSDAFCLTIEAASNFNPSPYDFVLSKIEIEKGETPTRVSVTNNQGVTVKGSPDNLEGFASFFHFEPDAASGTHAHYEYVEGNPWIATDSIPLVIGIK
jgi:hypothetical protein